MSQLRARCPYCGTYTAVALGPSYECHSCGREFGAGLVRVPRAWGAGGDAMAEAAALPLPLPEAAVVAEPSLGEQNLALALALPERPLVLGGCCCAHVGAVEGLSARLDRLALVWIDAHGDLNTPESSRSGDAWGMALRMLLDSGAVRIEDALLLGARDLDPPEVAFIEQHGLATEVEALERVLAGCDAVYVAFDGDALDPAELDAFMPVDGGMTRAEAVGVLERIAAVGTVAGMGLAGFTPASDVDAMTGLVAALDLVRA